MNVSYFKELPKPNIDWWRAPNVDNYMEESLPVQADEELSGIQKAALNCVAPLTLALLCMLEDVLERHMEMYIPSVEV